MADNEEYTSITVMLLPQESDPIVAASSEPAHVTVVWMGESADLFEEQIEAIVGEVRAYAAELDGPIVVPVVERGTLGDEGADVAFLEATDSLLAMREGLFEAAPTVLQAHDSVEQFPDWTPHVTLGYPETPARGEYTAEQVAFDRIGVWVGTERHNFVMGTPTSEESVTAAAAEVVEDVEEVEDDLDQDEMPFDEPEDGEELITEIPVHGVATLEGRPTGDGRGFRPGAISFGRLPAPLGYEFESSHGGDNSRVAIIGRIDEFWTVPLADDENVFEVRWRGVIMTSYERSAEAIEHIIDGSYRGLSVVVDSVELDVEEQREQVRQRLLAEKSMSEDEPFDGDIEEMLDILVGDGTQDVTWFKSARVRRFDMVPTGAYQEGDIWLGSEFEDELTPEQIEASAQALEDCGCTDKDSALEAINALIFRDYSDEERKRLADEGKALPDGSFPIADEEDLRNAIQAIGRASDPEKARAHIKKRARELDKEDLIPEDWSLARGGIVSPGTMALVGEGQERETVIPLSSFAPGTKDGPGWITHPIPTARIRRYWVRGKGAAKIRWGVPGDFNRCRRQLVKYVQNPEWLAGLCANMHKEALGIWPGEHHRAEALVASAQPAPLFSLVAAPAPVDASYFQNPNLTEPTGIVVDGDRIYGHIASWNVCHIAEPEGPGTCTLAPRSATNYAHFRTGTVMTTEGPVAVGSITMGTGHAGGRLGAGPAAAHYDNTGSVVADVACGEDRHGIWYSGRIRPGTSDDQIYQLLASGRLSGDWRRIGGNYELVAALVVNVPGYPVPLTSLAASADLGATSIVAAGIVDGDERHEEAVAETQGTPIWEGGEVLFDAKQLVVDAVEHYVLSQKRAAALDAARETLAAQLRAEARAAFARMEA